MIYFGNVKTKMITNASWAKIYKKYAVTTKEMVNEEYK